MWTRPASPTWRRTPTPRCWTCARRRSSFAAGHLPGAINIDNSAPDFADAVAELPKDGTYLVYCQTSNRSGVATDRMADLGFTDVYDLRGGIVAWADAGGPVVTD